MSFKSLTYCILLCVALIKTDPVPYKDCGSDPGVKVNLFDISGCSSFPCPFHKNETIIMKLNFTSNYEITSVTNNLYGIIAGVKVPFPIPNGDGCKNGLQCPVQAGQSNFEIVSVPILPAYPSISVFVRIELVDQNHKTFICTLFPAKISL